MKGKKKIVIAIIAVLTLSLVGCSNFSSLNSDGTGDMILSIADKPVNDVAHVYVTLDKVTVHNVDTGWTTINDFADKTDGELRIDLLQLRFDEQLLGQKTLPSGTYDQIRLYVAAKEDGTGHTESQGVNPANLGKSYVEYKNGDTENIFIPSGTKSGLKINKDSDWDGITIEDGSVTELVLDNNVAKIMHQTGNGKIMLRPTAIDVVNKVVSGNIQGRVVADKDGDGTADGAITNSDVVIDAVDSSGNVVKSTVATIEDPDGKEEPKKAGSFFLRGIKEGTYKLNVYLVNEDGNKITDTYKEKVKSDVQINARETTKLESSIILEKNDTTTN